MPHTQLRVIITLSLVLLQTGCSQQPATPADHNGYCLRAGDRQQFDCTAPALPINELRDPLSPNHRFTDEELMTLLAEIKLWLAQHRQALETGTAPPMATSGPTDTSKPIINAQLARPWYLILDDFSPAALQRSNSTPID